MNLVSPLLAQIEQIVIGECPAAAWIQSHGLAALCRQRMLERAKQRINLLLTICRLRSARHSLRVSTIAKRLNR